MSNATLRRRCLELCGEVGDVKIELANARAQIAGLEGLLMRYQNPEGREVDELMKDKCKVCHGTLPEARIRVCWCGL